MARYEVVARVKSDRRLSHADYVVLASTSYSLDKGMRFQRVEDLPDGMIAVVLQHNLSPRKHDAACTMANRSLAQLGIPARDVQQIDLHRLTRRKGRTLVRSWRGPQNPPGNESGDRDHAWDDASAGALCRWVECYGVRTSKAVAYLVPRRVPVARENPSRNSAGSKSAQPRPSM